MLEEEIRSQQWSLILCGVVTITFRVLTLFAVTTCYSYSKTESVVITCTSTWWRSNKSTHQPNPRLKLLIHVTILSACWLHHSAFLIGCLLKPEHEGDFPPWLLVRKLTIPTERPPLVSEDSTNFCGWRVSRGQRNETLRPLISAFKIGAAIFSFTYLLNNPHEGGCTPYHTHYFSENLVAPGI
jgi:hypothetical protein